MNEIPKERIKKFKRILKELGLYSVWLKERKKYIKRHDDVNVYDVLKHEKLDNIIDYSFCWEVTPCRKVWIALYEHSLNSYPYHDLDYFCTEKGIEELKIALKDKKVI